MTKDDYSTLADTVLDNEHVTAALRAIAVQTVRRDFDMVESSGQQPPARWNHLLMVASALTADPREDAQEAALRIAQACLTDDAATVTQREACALIFERLGNLPALNLARTRDHLAAGDRWTTVPVDLRLDAALRREELVIEMPGQRTLDANPFQREFWDLIGDHRWVSVSAPTSAGKTRIVREWIRALFATHEQMRAVYVAPTRALVQEVSQSLVDELGSDIKVHTLPWDSDIGQSAHEVYVLTQERMHLLQQRDPAFAPQFTFVDEAQNIGDGSRGILLSAVLDEAIERNAGLQLVFASPLTSNPEILLTGAPVGAPTTRLISETVTVNQNLLFAQQVPRKPSRFSLTLSYRGEETPVGVFSIAADRVTPTQRTAFIAAALGGESGNIVYANGPATAETTANLLWDILGPSADNESGILEQAAEYIRASIHDKYALAKVIKRGIGYHYGDIPLPVKTLVENLFRDGHLKYLVCTSTLLEGVNLPCRNIFIRGPRKGLNNPMSPADFWNLSGRAGRWGKEFQGNIICVDVNDASQWPDPPGARTRGVIRKAAQDALDTHEELIEYIAAGAPPAGGAVPEQLEAAYSFFATRRLSDRSIHEMHGLSAPDEGLVDLQVALDTNAQALTVPASIVRRHAGISPASMQRLYDAIRDTEDPTELALVPPEADEAKAVYRNALELIDEHLGGPFQGDLRRYALANLIVNWMNGIPLARLIDYRINWQRQNNRDSKSAATIRLVMADVEKIARFSAPKYLACYNDIVHHRLTELGIETGPAPDVTMMLELGVPRVTDMGLINAGLSRATAMAVSPFIADPNLDSKACLAWLHARSVETLDLPAFALREITTLLQAAHTVIGEV